LAILIACSIDSFKEEKKVIAIQTLNGFPNNLTDTVKKAIEEYYHFKTVVYEDCKIPKDFYVTIKSPRYRADSIIRYLRTNKPDSINHIIGLTKVDISVTKYDKNGAIKSPTSKYKDWGIFGLGFRPGVSCVVSSYRLKHTSQQKYIDRLKKVSLHELGHNLGLPHCPGRNCFMRDAAETIKTIDSVELNLCQKCYNKVQ